ncbi:MAG: protein kinase, partial [Synechococcaceae bacterium WB4_1_0192]|nr:protein kinase [Synechococcaceae bacterium WB4_1_0192]
AAIDLHQPLARLDAHPSDPSLLGLKNLGQEAWMADLSDGRTMELEPGKTCNLAALQDIRTSAGTLTLLA